MTCDCPEEGHYYDCSRNFALDAERARREARMTGIDRRLRGALAADTLRAALAAERTRYGRVLEELHAERARHAALVKAERECSGYYIGHDCGCTCHRAALDGEPSE